VTVDGGRFEEQEDVGAAADPDAITSLDVGWSGGCWTAAGVLWCWDHRDVPADAAPEQALVAAPVATDAAVRHVAIGGVGICVLGEAGEVACWEPGNMADGDPIAVSLPESATSIALGAGDHACAILASGRIACWGSNWVGELGRGDVSEQIEAPAPVLDIADAIHVDVGLSTTCAVRSDGAPWCWGSDNYGEVGDGPPAANTSVPVPAHTLGGGAIAVASGWDHSCALHRDGTVGCVGNNFRGQLGNGTTADTLYGTTVVDLVDGAAIDSRLDHVCALRASGRVACWGSDTDGQLGDGDGGDFAQATPADVETITDASHIAVSGDMSCAATSIGVACWGEILPTQAGQSPDRSGIYVDRPILVQLR
jgi:alpha-tubulin suppressor-like RCC1 family protein